MRIVLYLDDARRDIDGHTYPAGVGLPRAGDVLAVEGKRYRVSVVRWHIEPLDERQALRHVEIVAHSAGGDAGA